MRDMNTNPSTTPPSKIKEQQQTIHTRINGRSEVRKQRYVNVVRQLIVLTKIESNGMIHPGSISSFSSIRGIPQHQMPLN
jgi:hypothetical protein